MTYREGDVTSFIWSEYGTNRWTISAQDIINKKYTIIKESQYIPL